MNASARPMRHFRDQFGQWYHARTVAELRAQLGGGGSRVSRMYRDKAGGPTVHVGYVIGPHWLAEWAPVERAP